MVESLASFVDAHVGLKVSVRVCNIDGDKLYRGKCENIPDKYKDSTLADFDVVKDFEGTEVIVWIWDESEAR